MSRVRIFAFDVYDASMINLLYLALGCAAGVLSGLIGIGGGVLIVPALVYLFGMNQHRAQGTSLGALLLPVGALAFWEYYKAGSVEIKASILVAFGFAIGGYFGAEWAQHLPGPLLRKGFAILLIVIAIRMFTERV